MQAQKGITGAVGALVCVVGGLVWPSYAFGQYGIRDVQATPVFVYLDQVVAGTSVTYSTQILTRGGDTVIHVLEDAAPFRQLIASDDCRAAASGNSHGNNGHGHQQGGGKEHGQGHQQDGEEEHDEEDEGEGGSTRRQLASCVTVTVPATTLVRVLVRALDNKSAGRANLLRNGVQVVADFPFAGTQVKTTWVVNDVFETPLASPVRFPGASTDTQLLLIRDPPLGLVAYDDDSGVGLASRLVAPVASNGRPLSSATASYVVVASTSAAAQGPARLVQNDVLQKDTDGDGLGDQLEAFVDPAGYLPTSPTVPDTDNDGISDGWELLGRDGTHPQILSRWGANPRHRDLFIEVDRDRSGLTSGVTLSVAHAQAMAAHLALWPNAELSNPDGHDGVAVHVDNGIVATSEVYGDFGGSEDVTIAGDLLQAYAQHFVPERIGVFKYALAKPGCEEIAYLYGDSVVFASTCGDFAWQNLAYNLSRNLRWGASCCEFRHF